MKRTRRLFVVSDLHLGGRTDEGAASGTAICTQTAKLADFIDWVGSEADARPHEDVELVVNGDLFDFLCELEAIESLPDGLAADEALALRLAQRIEAEYSWSDEGTSRNSPLAAFKRFARSAGRLTLLLSAGGAGGGSRRRQRCRAGLRRLVRTCGARQQTNCEPMACS